MGRFFGEIIDDILFEVRTTIPEPPDLNDPAVRKSCFMETNYLKGLKYSEILCERAIELKNRAEELSGRKLQDWDMNFQTLRAFIAESPLEGNEREELLYDYEGLVNLGSISFRMEEDLMQKCREILLKIVD